MHSVISTPVAHGSSLHNGTHVPILTGVGEDDGGSHNSIFHAAPAPAVILHACSKLTGEVREKVGTVPCILRRYPLPDAAVAVYLHAPGVGGGMNPGVKASTSTSYTIMNVQCVYSSVWLHIAAGP